MGCWVRGLGVLVGVLTCFRAVRGGIGRGVGVCGCGYGWCCPRRSVLDAVDWTGWVPSKRSGGGLVYGGARVGVDWPGRWVGEAAVVSGVAWSARAGVLGLSFSGFRVLPVCSRLWMTAAMSAASVWAARPNARQESFSRLPSSLIMPSQQVSLSATAVTGRGVRRLVRLARLRL